MCARSLTALLCIALTAACESSPTELSSIGGTGSLTVAPTAANIPEGGTLRLTLTAHDDNGGSPLPSDVLWLSSDEKVATIGPGALVTGHHAGSATIVARWRGYHGSSTVTVEQADNLSPGSPCTDPGASARPSLEKFCFAP